MKTFESPLTQEEEAYYLQVYHQNDRKASKEAKDVLIERNLRLVAHVLKKYAGAPEEMEDMLSCAATV